jgi:hypothetical protein
MSKHRVQAHCVSSCEKNRAARPQARLALRCFGQFHFKGAKLDMTKKILFILMLATGMAFAQNSGNSGSPDDQQQPSQQQPQPTQPSANPQTPTSAGQNALTGCLQGSGDAWVLVAEGQSTPVKGDSSKLSPHNGHQVQLKGSQGSDGSFQVTDVVMVAESCAPGK